MSFRSSFEEFVLWLGEMLERPECYYCSDLKKYNIQISEPPVNKETILKKINYNGVPFYGHQKIGKRGIAKINLLPFRAAQIKATTIQEITGLLTTIKDRLRRTWLVGMSDEFRGETAVAFIVLKEDQSATEEEIIAHCTEHLAKYKVPSKVIFRDTLPMTAVGKVLRRELAKEFSN